MASVAGHRIMAANSRNQTGSAKSHPFTCVSCAIAFRSSDLQRSHMRSDWHQYNVKRRLASLPPLSSDIFAEKVLEAQANSTAAAARAAFEKQCHACQKVYYSENAFENHLQSQRHKMRATAIAQNAQEKSAPGTPSMVSSTISFGEPQGGLKSPGTTTTDDATTVSDAEPDFTAVMNGFKQAKLTDKASNSSRLVSQKLGPDSSPQESRRASSATDSGAVASVDTVATSAMPIHRCMFCNYDSPTLKLNVEHMGRFHNLFIPEQPYLVNLTGLITYLQAKVEDNHECLFCHKLKGSIGGCQTHMRDKGHCMIAFDTQEEMIEIGQFYDFRSSYSDASDVSDEEESADEEDENQGWESDADEAAPAKPARGKAGPAKLGAKRGPSLTTDGATESDPDHVDGWETDSSASVATAEIGAVPIDPDYHRLASHRHHAPALNADPRPHHAADGWHSHAHMAPRHAAFHDGHELVMPTGRTVGHRALAKYYRQNLRGRGDGEREEAGHRMITENGEGGDGHASRGQLMERGRQGRGVVSRANGGLGMLGVSEAKKKEARAVEKRQTRRAQRHEAHYQLGVSRRANNQRHYRDELLQ